MKSLRFRSTLPVAMTVVLWAVATTASTETVTVDFEELPFNGRDYYNGDDLAGGFSSRGTTFNNQYTSYGTGCCWNGWAYSRVYDPETPGTTNQYAAWPGRGAGGSSSYGIAFSGRDAGGGLTPLISLPVGAEPVQIAIANTTYAAQSMLIGDGFAKQFGGPTGNDPDWLLLSIEGRDAGSQLLAETSIYLADYRPADSADDTILDHWTEVDLSPLSGLGVTTLAFRMSSSDSGRLGMNTPAYFAADNLVLEIASLPGDLDDNGQVDEIDLAHWQQTYGTGSGHDLLEWQRAWAPAPAAASVPEPRGTVLIAAGLALWSGRRRGDA